MNQNNLSLSRTEIVLGLIYLPFQQFILPLIISALIPFFPPQPAAVYNFILLAINFAVTTILFRTLLARGAKQVLSSPFLCLRCAGVGFIAQYALSLGIGFIVVAIAPDFVNVNDQTINTLVQSNYGLMAISVVLLAPISEELLFRGLLFGALHRHSRLAAYLISTVVFSLVHVIGYIFYYDIGTLLLCFIQYLPASLSLAWAYERSGNILAPILLHMAVNQISLQFMR